MEKVLTSHPDVEEAYAIGVKDYKYGEIVGTFVRRKEGSTLTAERAESLLCRQDAYAVNSVLLLVRR